MSHLPIDTNPDSEPIRLFKSDFLEFFTHISPITVMVIWVPVTAFLLYLAVVDASGTGFPWHIPGGVLIGLFLWTVAEYLLHRFLFHYKPRTPAQERIFFMFHGVHHAQPQDKTRLVMPLPASIPLAVLFYGLFYLVVAMLLGAAQWVNPLMAGFIIGYLIYDLTHYATHHFPMRGPVLKYIKRHHMMHHYKDPDTRFGVSSPLWDLIFGTMGEGR
ncbi:MAG: sterol desaturase family protein [Anaerolineae bacterium]